MTPEELEFVAESVLVSIIPSIRLPRLQMITDEYGPFKPQMRCTVPLWLAITMKRGGHCQLVAPDWFQVGIFTQRYL